MELETIKTVDFADKKGMSEDVAELQQAVDDLITPAFVSDNPVDPEEPTQDAIIYDESGLPLGIMLNRFVEDKE